MDKTIIEEERTAAQRLHQETRKRIDGVLTEAQRTEQDARMKERMERHVDRLAKRLDLTPEQTTQVRAILDERRDNPDLDRAEVQARIAAVLTPEQKQEFESMGPRDERGEHHGKKDCGPGRDGPRDSPRGGPRGRPADGPADGPDGDGPDRR